MGPVRADQTFIEVPVIGVAGPERSFALRGCQAEVLRESVGRQQGEAAREPLVERELEGVVLGVADGGLLLDGAKLLVRSAGPRISDSSFRGVEGGGLGIGNEEA